MLYQLSYSRFSEGEFKAKHIAYNRAKNKRPEILGYNKVAIALFPMHLDAARTVCQQNQLNHENFLSILRRTSAALLFLPVNDTKGLDPTI